MFGLLNLDKPAGLTSRDAVNRVQRLVRPLKVGHAGTLDPLATGVLVVAVGQATRLVEYVQRMPKTYRATFLLGRTSDTDDIEGVVIELPEAAEPSEAQLRAALPQFVGTIEQTPPAYSALKVAGRRAYDLARRGQAVELASRPVEIQAIDFLGYAHPQLDLRIRCGSGTYIRSLGRDLARSAGTGAVMSALRREVIGPFTVEQAVPVSSLTFELISRSLLPPRLALGDLPQVTVNADAIRRLSRGQSIASRGEVDAAEIAAVSESGELVAILAARPGGNWSPAKNFAVTPS